MNKKLKKIALAKLRALLKERTQAQVAKLLGYSQPYISLIASEAVELSERVNDKLAKLAKLAR